MKMRFGKHYMSDLYLCQNALWETPDYLENELDKLTTQMNMGKVFWINKSFKTDRIRMLGEVNDFSIILVQIFPSECFIAIDLFSWLPDFDMQLFSESLINIFIPQVVAAETKIRAEHLSV